MFLSAVTFYFGLLSVIAFSQTKPNSVYDQKVAVAA